MMGQNVLSESADDNKTGRDDWYARGSFCFPEGPQQAREMGWQEPHEVQQGEVQGLHVGRNSAMH